MHHSNNSSGVNNNPNCNNNIDYQNSNNQQLCDEKLNLKPEDLNKVLQDVRAMRIRQDTLDSHLLLMKRENSALWREIASLRQKHVKQQQIVNKLLQFLITIVQPQRNMGGVKRPHPLMLQRTPEELEAGGADDLIEFDDTDLKRKQLQILKEVKIEHNEDRNRRNRTGALNLNCTDDVNANAAMMVPVIPGVEDFMPVDNEDISEEDCVIDMGNGPIIHELSGELLYGIDDSNSSIM